jgi:signal peptidase I
MTDLQISPPAHPSGKEPWLAVNLSKIFPGIGQIYAGRTVRGWVILAIALFLACLGVWLFISPTGNALHGIGLLVLFGVLSIWNLFDAHGSTKKGNSAAFETARKSQKDPWLAVFLSQIIPGLGHVYLRQWLGAIAFLGLFIGLSIVPGQLNNPLMVTLVKLAILILTIGAAVHAYLSAPVRRERSKAAIWIIAIAPILVSFFLAFGIRGFVAEARYIPSKAMAPTLEVNDRLIINKLSYQFQAPQRGDIIVFMPPEEAAIVCTGGIPRQGQGSSDTYIKRIIGLPGEQVEVRQGKVLINNQPLTEPYIQQPPEYQYGPSKVPTNHYWVLGDNRNNSCDGHYWGFVPKENIIGKATQRFWPSERSGSIQ